MKSAPDAEPVTLHSLWELIRESGSRWSDINAPELGAALAFYTMLSVAPLLLIPVGIARLFLGGGSAAQIAGQIGVLAGNAAASAVQSLLEHPGAASHGAIAAAVGFVMLLFGASSVFVELHDSLNRIWGVRSSGGSGIVAIVKDRFFSFALVLGIGFLLLVSLLVSAVIAAAGKFFQGYLPAPEPLLHLESAAGTLLLVTLLFALLYKVVPDARIEWRDVWIGAAVTSLLFSIGKSLIALYLGKASMGSAYGAAGSLVVFLVWTYYSAQIFLLGAEFTHAFASRHGSRARAPAERQPRVD